MRKIIVILMAVIFVFVSMSLAFAGDGSWTRTTNRNSSTDIGENLRDIAYAKIALGFLSTFVETAFQPQPQYYQQPQRRQYSRPVSYQPSRNYNSECSRYAANPGALSACERGVSQRNMQIQKDLEKRAYDAGRNGGIGYQRSNFY